MTAVTTRELGLYLGASAQACRHCALSATALRPLLGEDQVRQLQGLWRRR